MNYKTYIFESKSYWDSEKGQARSKRKCIGKLDPVTGEIIPTGKRGRAKKEPEGPGMADGNPSRELMEAKKELLSLRFSVSDLEQKLKETQAHVRELEEALKQIQQIAGKYTL